MFRPSYSDSFGPRSGRRRTGSTPAQAVPPRAGRPAPPCPGSAAPAAAARPARGAVPRARGKQIAQCASILAMAASRSTAGGPSGMSGSYGTSLGLGLVVTAGVALQQHRARAVQPGQAGHGDLGHAEDGAVVQPSRPQAFGMERPTAALRLGLDELGVQPL